MRGREERRLVRKARRDGSYSRDANLYPSLYYPYQECNRAHHSSAGNRERMWVWPLRSLAQKGVHMMSVLYCPLCV